MPSAALADLVPWDADVQPAAASATAAVSAGPKISRRPRVPFLRCATNAENTQAARPGPTRRLNRVPEADRYNERI